jgi:hypothetical protein
VRFLKKLKFDLVSMVMDTHELFLYKILYLKV